MQLFKKETNPNVVKRVLILVPLIVFAGFTLVYGWISDRAVEIRISRIEEVLGRIAVMKEETAKQISAIQEQDRNVIADLNKVTDSVKQLTDSLQKESELRRTMHAPSSKKLASNAGRKRPKRVLKSCTKESIKRTPFGDTVLVETTVVPVPCR